MYEPERDDENPARQDDNSITPDPSQEESAEIFGDLDEASAPEADDMEWIEFETLEEGPAIPMRVFSQSSTDENNEESVGEYVPFTPVDDEAEQDQTPVYTSLEEEVSSDGVQSTDENTEESDDEYVPFTPVDEDQDQTPVYTALEEEDDSVQEYTEQDEAEFLAELLGEDQESDVYVPEDETPTGLSAEDAELIASAAAHEDDDQDWVYSHVPSAILQSSETGIDTERSIEDLTIAEALGMLRRAPMPTLRALITVARTPVTPRRTPARRPAYATSTTSISADGVYDGEIPSPDPWFEDLTIAEMLGLLRRSPVSTLRSLITVTRTPVTPRRAPARRPAYARTGIELPERHRLAAWSRASVPDVPQIEDTISAGREAILLALRVIAFVLAWWGTLTMVSSVTRSEADGLNVGMPYLVIAFFVWLVAEILAGWSAAPPDTREEPDDKPLNIADLLPRLAMLAFAFALGAVAVSLTSGNQFTFGGALAWFGSIAAGVWAVMPLNWTPVKPFENLDWLRIRLNWVFFAMVVITLMGTYFRLKDLNLLPPEMTSDHVEMLLDTQDTLDGQASVFYAGNGGREPVQFYLLAFFSQLPGLGLNFSTLKLLNALEGIMTIPIMFFMGRTVIGERERKLGTIVGLFMAAFVAVSYWHVILSRMGERIVLMPLVTALFIIFMARALRHNRRSDFVLAGLTLGAGLYTYQAYRLMPLVMAVGGVIAMFFYLRRVHELRRLVLNFVALGIVAMLVYLPLFSYSIQFPEDYWRRTSGRLFGDEITQTTDEEGNLIFRQPTIQERIDAFQRNFPALMTNIRNALLMYNWKGDVAWVQNHPNEPAFDPITGGLLVVGVAAWIGRMLRRRDPFAWTLPAMFLILMLPSALAIAQPIENPSFTRMSGTLPLAYLLVALALALILRSAARLVGGSGGTLVAGLAGVGLIIGSYIANQNTYFNDYYETYRAGSYPYSEAGQHLRSFGINEGFGNVFIINRPAWWDHRAVGINAGRIDYPNGIPSLADVPRFLQLALNQAPPYQLDVDKDLEFLYASDDFATHEWLQEKFPDGVWLLIQTYHPEDSFYVFRTPPLGEAGFNAFLEDAADDDLSQYSG